jgi:hypothetical protein
MTRSLFSFVVVFGVAATPCIAADATPIELKTMNFELPDSDRMFPSGAGSDAINNNCLACHSADMVLNQPTMSREAWASVVTKMINNYKAPIAPEDFGTIVDYLVALKSAK